MRVPLSWEGNDMEVKRFRLPITGSHLLMGLFFSAARLRSRFRRVAAFARSLSAKALRSRFITPPSSARIARGDPYTVVPSRAEDAPGRVLPTYCLILPSRVHRVVSFAG